MILHMYDRKIFIIIYKAPWILSLLRRGDVTEPSNYADISNMFVCTIHTYVYCTCTVHMYIYYFIRNSKTFKQIIPKSKPTKPAPLFF